MKTTMTDIPEIKRLDGDQVYVERRTRLYQIKHEIEQLEAAIENAQNNVGQRGLPAGVAQHLSELPAGAAVAEASKVDADVCYGKLRELRRACELQDKLTREREHQFSHQALTPELRAFYKDTFVRRRAELIHAMIELQANEEQFRESLNTAGISPGAMHVANFKQGDFERAFWSSAVMWFAEQAEFWGITDPYRDLKNRPQGMPMKSASQQPKSKHKGLVTARVA